MLKNPFQQTHQGKVKQNERAKMMKQKIKCLEMMLVCMLYSVTRLLDYLFNIWPFATLKYAQRNKKLPKYDQH